VVVIRRLGLLILINKQFLTHNKEGRDEIVARFVCAQRLPNVMELVVSDNGRSIITVAHPLMQSTRGISLTASMVYVIAALFCTHGCDFHACLFHKEFAKTGLGQSLRHTRAIVTIIGYLRHVHLSLKQTIPCQHESDSWLIVH